MLRRFAPIAAVAALVAVASPAAAQQATSSPWKFGAIGGLNLASLSGDNDNSENLTGFTIGLTASKAVNANFAIQPEVHFSRKGGQETDAGATAEIALNTIDIPVLGIFNFGEGNVKPHLAVGPHLTYIVGCDASISGGGASLSASCNDEVKSLDYGLTAGAGLGWMAGGREWGVHARYQLGLANIDDTGGDLKTRNIQLLVTVGF